MNWSVSIRTVRLHDKNENLTVSKKLVTWRKETRVSIYIQIFAKRNRPYIKTFSQLAIMKYFLGNAGLTNVSTSEASF